MGTNGSQLKNCGIRGKKNNFNYFKIYKKRVFL